MKARFPATSTIAAPQFGVQLKKIGTGFKEEAALDTAISEWQPRFETLGEDTLEAVVRRPYTIGFSIGDTNELGPHAIELREKGKRIKPRIGLNFNASLRLGSLQIGESLPRDWNEALSRLFEQASAEVEKRRGKVSS